MTINYAGNGTPEERLAKLEKRVGGLALMFWTSIIAIILGAGLFTAGLWALGRAGLF